MRVVAVWRRLAVVVVVAAFGLAWVPGARAASSSFFTGVGIGSMSSPRLGEGAAPLPAGRVLIVGGESDTGTALSSAELFDPQTDTFTALSNAMTSPRYEAVVAPLPDGRVLIAGGGNQTGLLSSAEVFNPQTATFTALPNSMTGPRAGAVAAPLPDGRVLIAGGGNQTGPLSSAELFDPQTDTFTALPNAMTSPREFAAAAPLPDGRVLIAGGENHTGPLSSAELFDPQTDTFTALPNAMTSPRDDAVAAPLPDGRVLIAAGDNQVINLSSVDVFDPQTETFTALPNALPVTSELPAAAPLPDGRVLIAGGLTAGGQSGTEVLSSAEVFEPAPEAVAAGGKFGAQTVSQGSASQTIVITNLGAQALQIGGATLGGANPGDFALGADHCSGRRLAFDQSCTIEASFTPSASGARSALLQLEDNEPTAGSVALSGSGVAPNSGPAGAQGPTGAPGPIGPRGPAGKIRLVTCKTVTKTVKRHGRKHKVHRRKCHTRLVRGTITFTTTAARATLVRGRVVYATGSARLNRLTLRTRRRVRPGRYTLVLRHRDGHHHWIATRHTITIA